MNTKHIEALKLVSLHFIAATWERITGTTFQPGSKAEQFARAIEIEVITTIREALNAPLAQERSSVEQPRGEATLAQQQERCRLCDCTGDIHSPDGEWRGECPYCKQQQEPQAHKQEPVAWAVYWGHEFWQKHSVYFRRETADAVASEIESFPTEVRPLVFGDTSPPASKPWVGLTDDETSEIVGSFDYRYDIAKAIEAKLREKNA